MSRYATPEALAAAYQAALTLRDTCRVPNAREIKAVVLCCAIEGLALKQDKGTFDLHSLNAKRWALEVLMRSLHDCNKCGATIEPDEWRPMCRKCRRHYFTTRARDTRKPATDEQRARRSVLDRQRYEAKRGEWNKQRKESYRQRLIADGVRIVPPPLKPRMRTPAPPPVPRPAIARAVKVDSPAIHWFAQAKVDKVQQFIVAKAPPVIINPGVVVTTLPPSHNYERIDMSDLELRKMRIMEDRV